MWQTPNPLGMPFHTFLLLKTSQFFKEDVDFILGNYRMVTYRCEGHCCPGAQSEEYCHCYLQATSCTRVCFGPTAMPQSWQVCLALSCFKHPGPCLPGWDQWLSCSLPAASGDPNSSGTSHLPASSPWLHTVLCLCMHLWCMFPCPHEFCMFTNTYSSIKPQ